MSCAVLQGHCCHGQGQQCWTPRHGRTQVGRSASACCCSCAAHGCSCRSPQSARRRCQRPRAQSPRPERGEGAPTMRESVVHGIQTRRHGHEQSFPVPTTAPSAPTVASEAASPSTWEGMLVSHGRCGHCHRAHGSACPPSAGLHRRARARRRAASGDHRRCWRLHCPRCHVACAVAASEIRAGVHRMEEAAAVVARRLRLPVSARGVAACVPCGGAWVRHQQTQRTVATRTCCRVMTPERCRGLLGRWMVPEGRPPHRCRPAEVLPWQRPGQVCHPGQVSHPVQVFHPVQAPHCVQALQPREE